MKVFLVRKPTSINRERQNTKLMIIYIIILSESYVPKLKLKKLNKIKLHAAPGKWEGRLIYPHLEG